MIKADIDGLKKTDEHSKRHTLTTQGIVFLVNKIILHHAYILIHQPFKHAIKKIKNFIFARTMLVISCFD